MLSPGDKYGLKHTNKISYFPLESLQHSCYAKYYVLISFVTSCMEKIKPKEIGEFLTPIKCYFN